MMKTDSTLSALHVPRGLDHLVIGVRDLDAAGERYARFGFTVGARNRHPWGTENRIVQFPGAFLELVTVAEPGRIPEPHGRSYSFGGFVRDALARGEGLSMTVLESQDAKADALRFSTDGIGPYDPFFFERMGVGPDGAPRRVAFSLAFAEDSAARDCGFFVCQQHEPQNFWNRSAQRHANGVTGLAAAVMVAENPTDHHIFLTGFTGQRSLESSSFGISAALPRGRFDILNPKAAAFVFGAAEPVTDKTEYYAGFIVTVPDLVDIKRYLGENRVEFIQTPGRIVIPAADNCGTAIAFEAGLPV